MKNAFVTLISYAIAIPMALIYGIALICYKISLSVIRRMDNLIKDKPTVPRQRVKPRKVSRPSVYWN